MRKSNVREGAMEMNTNRVPLDRALVDEFVIYQKNIRENTISMAQKAFDIRSQYLTADGRKYDPEFEKWWSNYKLDFDLRQASKFHEVGFGWRSFEPSSHRRIPRSNANDAHRLI